MQTGPRARGTILPSYQATQSFFMVRKEACFLGADLVSVLPRTLQPLAAGNSSHTKKIHEHFVIPCDIFYQLTLSSVPWAAVMKTWSPVQQHREAVVLQEAGPSDRTSMIWRCALEWGSGHGHSPLFSVLLCNVTPSL